MKAFSSGAFGSGQRLPATGFVVFGLLTFWIFTVLSFASALRGHLDLRWKEFSARESLKGADAMRLDAVRREGFALPWAVPWAVAAMLGADALWVATWFYRWILSGDVSDYGAIMLQVGGSAVLFYAAILALFLWALGMVRRHELAELLLHEAGVAALGEHAPVPAGALLDRWERQAGQVSVFLVVAVPLSFSPALGAHHFLGRHFELGAAGEIQRIRPIRKDRGPAADPRPASAIGAHGIPAGQVDQGELIFGRIKRNTRAGRQAAGLEGDELPTGAFGGDGDDDVAAGCGTNEEVFRCVLHHGSGMSQRRALAGTGFRSCGPLFSPRSANSTSSHVFDRGRKPLTHGCRPAECGGYVRSWPRRVPDWLGFLPVIPACAHWP